jgi:threonine/homoserine/homoserine lactone efflux protein
MPTEIAWLFIFGVGFGLAATIPPGPINAQIARRTVKYGWLPGVAFGGGSIFFENILAVIATLGYARHFAASPRVTIVMLFLGFMIMTLIGAYALVAGYKAWQDPAGARTAIDATPEDPLAPPVRPGVTRAKFVSMPRAFFAGIGLAAISPYNYAFYLVAMPSAARDAIASSPVIWALPLGVLVGTSAWVAGFSAMLAWLKRYSSTGMWADLVGGVMLLAFAALTLLKLAQTLRGHPLPDDGIPV